MPKGASAMACGYFSVIGGHIYSCDVLKIMIFKIKPLFDFSEIFCGGCRRWTYCKHNMTK